MLAEIGQAAKEDHSIADAEEGAKYYGEPGAS